MERTLAFRIDEEFHRAIKVKLAADGKTLKDYVLGLIEKDLRTSERSPIDPQEISTVADQLQRTVDQLRSIAEG